MKIRIFCKISVLQQCNRTMYTREALSEALSTDTVFYVVNYHILFSNKVRFFPCHFLKIYSRILGFFVLQMA
jgi:hypothetical protein